MLKLNAVTLAYDKSPVVKNLGFSLQKGETACLIGPSGSGKSSVLRGIAGFQSISGGSITLRNQMVSDANTLLPPEARKFGMVFQDYALFPHLTVEQNVIFGLQMLSNKAAKKQAAAMLELVGLNDNAQRYCHQLSGGQQQRVAIARALAPEPDLLLLDEPFSNLDADLRSQLSRDLRTILKQQSITTLMVTHDQAEAFNMADNLGVIMEGKLLQWGSPVTVYQQPVNQSVANFVGESSYLEGRIIDSDCKIPSVQTVLGQHASYPHSKAVGDKINVLFRPESLCFDKDSSITARIIHKIFRGADSRYTLSLSDQSEITIASANHLEFSEGEKVGIRVIDQPLQVF